MLAEDLIQTSSQLFQHFVELGGCQDIWRRKQDMIAQPPIYGPAHRVTEQAIVQRPLLDRCVQSPFRRERLLAGAIRNHLYCPKETAPANIAHMRMIAKSLTQPRTHVPSKNLDMLQQPPLADDLLDRKRCCSRHRVPAVGMAVLEITRTIYDNIINFALAQHRTYRLVACPQAFSNRNNVRDNPFLLARE